MHSKYGIRNINEFSRKCYYAGIIAGVVLLCGIFIIIHFNIDILHILPRCEFYDVTGLYCPGCGGTRSVNALLHGNLLKSLLYHPFVLYFLVIYVVFMLSHILNIISKEHIKAMIFRPVYFYLGAAIVIIQWIIKNILIIYYGIAI